MAVRTGMKLNVIKGEERDFQVISEPDKVLYVLREYTSFRNLFVKGYSPAVPAIYVGQDTEKGELTFQVSPELEINGDFTLYCTLKKQLEVDFEMVRHEASGNLVGRYTRAKIARENRSTPRFPLTGGIGYGNKFQISKNKIDLKPLSGLVSNKVIFHEFERQLAVAMPGVKILDLGFDNDDFLARYLKKHVGPVFVADTQSEAAWQSAGVADKNLAQYLGTETLGKTMLRFRDRAIASLVAVPIIYENLSGERFPIGYIQLEHAGDPLGPEMVTQLEEQAAKLVEKIKDANSVLFDIHQDLINLSEHGAALLVTEPELASFIQQRNEMVFNVVIKEQVPVRVYAEIRHILELDKGRFLVGLRFAGRAFRETRNTIQNFIRLIAGAK